MRYLLTTLLLGLLGAVPASQAAVSPSSIPLGDGHVTTSPKVGYVDACSTTFGQGGAMTVGPWLDSTGGTWNATTKPDVQGSVAWPSASYTQALTASTRTLTFNSLPRDHTSGTFPIATSDPARQYDGNPNTIKAQSFSWALPRVPAAATTPGCVSMGSIGVLSDGVALYNALDGGGRDAAAHEVLDSCGGHPDQSGTYHHHEVPSCLLTSAKKGTSTLVGYALDGYGIYVQKYSDGTLPTNASLDPCHGRTSTVVFDGRRKKVFHYVATLEYPYTVGCYHGTAISTGRGGGSGGPPSGGGMGGPPPRPGASSSSTSS